MPEERVPVKGAFPLVGFRVWTRVGATGFGRGGLFWFVAVAVAGTWYR